jgi:septal ring factor EnvC (AmiA/AmiB activator)
MIDSMTIALFVLALISFIFAIIAVVWLSIVSKHLSALAKKVLESEDIERVIQAADETVSFGSRISGLESKADESQNQLAGLQTRLSEITANLDVTGQTMDKYTSDLAKISEKIAAFELRYDEFENNVNNKLDKLSELETQVNDLVTNLKSVEGIVNNNKTGLAGIDQSVKALTDKIEALEKFRTIVEKTHGIIQAAFIDMRASASPEKALGVSSETAKPEEASRFSQDEQEEVADQGTVETEAYHYP